VLFSLYPVITQHYFVLCFVLCSGVLQWVAARNRNLGLSLLGPWGLGWPGTIGGGLLVIGGFVWFFMFTPGLFETGLAGGELSTLFGAGGLMAVVVARLAGVVWTGSRIRSIQDELYNPH